MSQIDNIIEKYEVPAEFYEALWDAYQEGVKRGFIDASIKAFNEADIK